MVGTGVGLWRTTVVGAVVAVGVGVFFVGFGVGVGLA
jgi:hypothetical protein